MINITSAEVLTRIIESIILQSIFACLRCFDLAVCVRFSYLWFSKSRIQEHILADNALEIKYRTRENRARQECCQRRSLGTAENWTSTGLKMICVIVLPSVKLRSKVTGRNLMSTAGTMRQDCTVEVRDYMNSSFPVKEMDIQRDASSLLDIDMYGAYIIKTREDLFLVARISYCNICRVYKLCYSTEDGRCGRIKGKLIGNLALFWVWASPEYSALSWMGTRFTSRRSTSMSRRRKTLPTEPFSSLFRRV